MAKLRENMLPTPEGWRENMLSTFPPPVEIGFGVEVEYPSSRYAHEGLDIKLSVGTEPGFDVQTDQLIAKPETYPELVQEPRTRRSQVQRDIVAGATAFGDRLVDQTFAKGKNTTTVGAVASHARPGYADLGIQTFAALPVTNLHATGGAAEKDIPRMLESYIEPRNFQTMLNVVDRAEERLRQLVPEVAEFSPDLRGFLSSVVMAALEGGMPPVREVQTAHSSFMFSHRSAFSWRYYLNLQDRSERSAARALLLKVSDKRPTLLSEVLMEATRRGGNDRIFSAPYAGPLKPDGTFDLFDGPTHDEFFESIVKMTHDALTNMEGYGTASALGGWISGDLQHHLAGFELRNIASREIQMLGALSLFPSSNVLDDVVKDLYNFWAKFNPRLERPGQRSMEDMMALADSINMTSAVGDFNALHRSFREVEIEVGEGQDAGPRFGEKVRDRTIDLQGMKLGRWLDSKEGDSSWDEPRQAHQALMTYLKGDPSSMRAGDIRDHVTRLGLALWDCDSRGTGRRERQAAATASTT